MCGLAGIITPRGTVDTERAVHTMLDAELHRGPDSAGVWSGSLNGHGVGIGLRRLRILDLSTTADQPMVSPDGRFALVFNGEIYNYVELREELQRDGVPFRTHGDTEVLLHALIRWGREAFNRLNGMWAVVLVDAQTGRILISRDRFGVKPFYTYTDGRTLWVASEVKCILAACPQKFAVNPAVVKAFLRQGLLDTGQDTFFSGIRELPAGHFAEGTPEDFVRQRAEPQRFWRLPAASAPGDERALIEQVRDVFIDAVRIRLRSDVPVGVLLSGGCDSSAIAAAVNHLYPARRDIRLISAVGESGPDEQPFIDMMGRHLARPIDKVVLNYRPEEAFGLMSEAIWYNDEPIGGFSSIAHYLLMKRALELKVTVLLSGQGADESLCGYRKYLGFYVQQLVREGRLARAAAVLGGFARNRTVLSQMSFDKAKYYLPSWLRSAEVDVSGPALKDIPQVPVGLQGGSVVARQAVDLESLSVPALVHYEDRMSMSSSREIRLPFLDYRFVSLLLPLPPEYKLRDGWTKWIFRKALEPLLPEGIVWRRDKQGFTVPQITWFRRELRPAMQKLLGEPWLSEDAGLVDRPAIRRSYDRYVAGGAQGSGLGVDDFFSCVSLELWMRRYAAHLHT
ncbi:MAG: asparagine synthase (glutamine-hydrolyzing) [Vicinamibacterales bacterium]